VTGFLLDTNVVSELMKLRPSRKVSAWVMGTAETLMRLSVITIEIRKDISSSSSLGESPVSRAARSGALRRGARCAASTAAGRGRARSPGLRARRAG
jgi:predicted nucleic acid-binding protein